jgi:hypothetical protein
MVDESRFERQAPECLVDEALDVPRQLIVGARIEHDPVLGVEVQPLRRVRAAIRAVAER